MSNSTAKERDFLHSWFEGFSEGLGRLSESHRGTILGECGKACARSYTAGVFQEEWERSGDIDRFLTNLAQRFPEASYCRIDEDKIEVRYLKCACDLVAGGYIDTPHFCQCSAANLKANFESSLKQRVDVKIESSILGGAGQCVLIAYLKGDL